MKNKKLSFVIPSLVIMSGACFSSVNASEVKLEFIEPKKFSDYEMSGQTRKKSLTMLEKQLNNMFTEIAKEIVGDEYKLAIKVKNIDLPGNIRYGMGQTSHDIRVIDTATLFKLEFEYILTNATGETVKQGQHLLKDFTDSQQTSLQMRNRSALGYFEKPLKKWMKATLAN
jgi:hypothetical protein